jgi:hypothetical protein
MTFDTYITICTAAIAAYLGMVIMMVGAALLTVIVFEMMGVRAHA